MVRVKICGITNGADARLATRLGAGAIGLNFYRPSPRYITPAAARRIVRRLPRRVQAVGVFVNAPLQQIRRIARAVDLDFIQLHGDESPAMVERVAAEWPVIKAFRVRSAFRPAVLKQYAAASAFLLDGFHPGLRGGTGKQSDWRIARRASRYGPIILAGGLGPGNIAAAIRAARPFAVDVNSGIESRPGRKDPAKLRAVMREIERINKRTR